MVPNHPEFNKDGLPKHSEAWDEIISKTFSQQQAKVATYRALRAQGLPVPPDLEKEVGE